LTHRVNGFFAFWAWRSHARLAPQAFRRHQAQPGTRLRVTEATSPRFAHRVQGFLLLGMAQPCKACPASLQAAPAQPEPASRLPNFPTPKCPAGPISRSCSGRSPEPAPHLNSILKPACNDPTHMHVSF